MLQWAGLDAPPIGHTVVSSRGYERLYIKPVFDRCNPIVTGSLLFVAPVRRQAAASSCRVVLCSSQVSARVLLCAVDCVFRAVFVTQPVSGMAILQRTQRVRVTLGSPELYDLDPECVPDVLGLYARSRRWRRWLRSCLGCDSQCIRVLIPDDDVGYRGFHDVMLFDRTDEDAPYVDLSALRQQWPVLVISGMANCQLELEELCRMCKNKYCGAPTWLCTFCGKVIRLDMFRHVANYHLELAQLWWCPVSWCTQWKGTPQDCIDHIRLVHSVPATVKAANLGRWFPPWTVTPGHVALKATVSGVSTDALLFSRSGTPLVHRYRVFGRG